MRLYLHAGTHKTGTSTIQRALAEERQALSVRGLLYPDARPHFGGTYDAHHPVAHAVASGEEQIAAARGFLDDVRAQAEGHEAVLLSAEPIYRHVDRTMKGPWWIRHRGFLERFASELEAFQCEVVLVFRRRDAFMESLYKERVSQGWGEPFAALLDESDHMLDYARQVETFRATFGNVRLLRYEDLAVEGLLSSFLRRLGYRIDDAHDRARERPSADGRLTLWMAARYRDNPDPDLVTHRRRFTKNPVSDDLFEDYGGVTLWTDPAQRRSLLDRYGDTGPIDDPRIPAALSAETAARIDAAFDRYLAAKGLPSRAPATSR